MITSIFVGMLNLLMSLSMAVMPNTAEALPACETEDSANCFWDASERGNGSGVDFHDINGVAYYACDGLEDSANCFWDASQQGNGQGRSFTDVNGTAVYWDTL